MVTATAYEDRLATRDVDLWRKRGRTLLFALGVATLLMSVVTFVAHNAVYLSTLAKLGVLAAALFASAVGWVLIRFDSAVSQSLRSQGLGLLAQLLIGVWLAAAGQLYQAPGGVQDLLLTWAVLGLPFALASRSAAHWALWIGVVVLAFTSPMGFRLAPFADAPALLWTAVAAVFPIAAYIVGGVRKAPQWFVVLMSALVSVLLFFVAIAVLDAFKPSSWVIWSGAAAAAIALAFHAWKARQSLASLSLFTFAALSFPVLLLTRGIGETLFDDSSFTSAVLVLAMLYGGATWLLVVLFKRFVQAFADAPTETTLKVPTAETDDAAPWYMDAFIALGGIVTALFALLFLGLFLGVTLAMAEEAVWVVLAIIGLALFGAALALHRATASAFLRHFGGTLMVAGAGAAVTGVAGATEFSVVAAALTGIVLSAAAIFATRDRVIEVIFTAGAAASVLLLLNEAVEWEAYLFEPLSLAVLGGAGVAALGWRIGGRHYAASGAVLLATSILVGVAHDIVWSALGGNTFAETTGLLSGWPQTGYQLGFRLLAAVAVVGLLRVSPFGRNLPSLPVLAALTVVATLLPAGGVAAFLLLLCGYALGSRSLSLIGAIVVSLFLFRAYFDLNLTLLELSAVTALCGVVLLGIWHFSSRSVP